MVHKESVENLKDNKKLQKQPNGKDKLLPKK